MIANISVKNKKPLEIRNSIYVKKIFRGSEQIKILWFVMFVMEN